MCLYVKNLLFVILEEIKQDEDVLLTYKIANIGGNINNAKLEALFRVIIQTGEGNTIHADDDSRTFCFLYSGLFEEDEYYYDLGQEIF